MKQILSWIQTTLVRKILKARKFNLIWVKFEMFEISWTPDECDSDKHVFLFRDVLLLKGNFIYRLKNDLPSLKWLKIPYKVSFVWYYTPFDCEARVSDIWGVLLTGSLGPDIRSTCLGSIYKSNISVEELLILDWIVRKTKTKKTNFLTITKNIT